jgi:hypothetical protein
LYRICSPRTCRNIARFRSWAASTLFLGWARSISCAICYRWHKGRRAAWWFAMPRRVWMRLFMLRSILPAEESLSFFKLYYFILVTIIA